MSSAGALFLDADQLLELTHLRQKHAQIQWLRRNGFTVIVRSDGSPLVSIAHVEAMLGAPLVRTRTATEPDWTALDDAQAHGHKSKAA